MTSPFASILDHLAPVNDSLVLAGGFAVNHHGYTRNTLDLDLICSEPNAQNIKRRLADAGYSDIETGPVALHCRNPQNGFRIDLLLVDPDTFHTLRMDAVESRIDESHVLQALSLEHLLAMKIHALACQPVVRRDKDLSDIAWLSFLNNLSPENDIHPLCLQFGTPELWHEISNAIQSLRP